MNQIRTAIEGRLSLRFAILGVALLAFGLAFIPPSATLKVAYAIGYFLPAILVGGAAGWLSYSRRVWLWTTGVLAVLTLLLWAADVFIFRPPVACSASLFCVN